MLMLLALLAIQFLIIAGLVSVFRRLRLFGSHALVLGFSLFGLPAGVLAVWLWPNDTSAYSNPLAVWAGDWLYVQAIQWLGDPYSDQAHYTIPWLLRVPQVYAFASCALYGALGLVVEWLYRGWAPRRKS